MHWLGYNDAVSWLNKAKTRMFQPTANFEIFEIYLYFVLSEASAGPYRYHNIHCMESVIFMPAD